MPEPMEGPFAAKLKAATEGRDFPKASIDALDVSQGLDLSGGGKTGREKRRARHERRELEEREGVSGRSVHTRGHFVEAVPAEEVQESPEEIEAKRLFSDILAQCEAFGQLNAFMDAHGYRDSEGNLMEVVADRIERANRTMLPLKEGRAITSAEVGNLRDLLEQSNQEIADLREALEGLESSGELVLSPEIKSLLETKSDLPMTETAHPGASVGPSGDPVVNERSEVLVSKDQPEAEKRPYASFDTEELRALWRRQSPSERIDMVTDQIKEWRTFDEAIRQFKDEERFKEDLKARGLGEKYDQVLRLTGRNDTISDRVAEIRQALEKNGKLDQKEAAFLTAIFFDYHELLVVAEGIVAERDRETPIVEAEKNENEIVASLKSNQERVLKRLRAIKTREEFEQYKKEDITGGTTTIAEIDVEGLRHFLGDKYPENDERLVGKLLQLAKNLQGEIVTSYREVEKKFSGMPAPQSLETAAVNGEIQENREAKIRERFGLKVTRLKTLLTEWEALEKEFGDQSLRQAIRKLRQLERGKPLPPTGKIAKWFAEHDGPKAWQGRNATADRALLVNDALPSMEGMVRDGLVVAEKLRAEREVAEAALTSAPVAPEAGPERVESIVRGDIWTAPAAGEKSATTVGRRVIVTGINNGKVEYRFFDVDDLDNAVNMGFGSASDESAMREWLAKEGFTYDGRREDEVGPPAASVVTLDRRPVVDGELTEWERMNPVEQNRLRRELFSRKDRFVTGLNEQLKRAGVNDADRRNTVIKYLDEYLPQMISLVVKVPLQETDRESLLRDLKKEIAIA